MLKAKRWNKNVKGRIKNDEIDFENGQILNFDLVEDERHLYHRVKDRVDYYKEQGSRVQKNSVGDCIPISLRYRKKRPTVWEKHVQKHYFKTCKRLLQ